MKLFRNILAIAALASLSFAPALATQQTVTIGTPGAGGGDPLYTAFGKINSNFGELYSARPYIPGNYYLPFSGAPGAGGNTVSTGAAYCLPFSVRSAITISELGARVTTAVAASAFEVEIYANATATGRPNGAPLASITGASGATVANVNTALASNVSLVPGIYWQCEDVNTSGIAFEAPGNLNYMNDLIGTSTLTNLMAAAQASNSVSFTMTYGSPPTLNSGTTFTEVATPRAAMVFFRVFSTP